MTPEYKARRTAKHEAQAASKPQVSGGFVTQTIDLTPRIPRLAFLNGKTFKQANGGRKNNSGHGFEHAQANRDDRNPFKGEDGNWYWLDETEQVCETGFVTRDQAETDLMAYVKTLNSPKEIGGICENLGLPGLDGREV